MNAGRPPADAPAEERGTVASPPVGSERPPTETSPAGDPETGTAAAPALSRTARFAWGMVIAILIGLAALVIYVFTRPPITASGTSTTPTPAPVVAALAHLPASVFDTVGVQITDRPTPLTAPSMLTGQPRLELDGKPEVFFVGADYCPFCAATRWPLVVALSRFGRFTGLQDTQSSGTSAFAGIPTFSFAHTRYDSPYLSFAGVELYSDEQDANGTYARRDTLTPTEASLVQRYGAESGSAPAIPFVDIGNRMVVTTSPFTPGLLTRHSQADIVSAIQQPEQRSGQAVLASANFLSAGLCQVTGQQPSAVCTSKGVRDADAALGLS